jgi:hypothetical protein
MSKFTLLLTKSRYLLSISRSVWETLSSTLYPSYALEQIPASIRACQYHMPNERGLIGNVLTPIKLYSTPVRQFNMKSA